MAMKQKLPYFIVGCAILLAQSRASFAGSPAALFQSNCGSCHGNAGKGDGPSAKSLSTPPADLTASTLSEGQIASVIKNGKKACPAWGKSMKDPDISALATFVKGLQ